MNLSFLRRHTESWYVGYAFQAMVVFGTGGILMPIIVNEGGNAARAGTVVAFFYIGQLLAPLMGEITDRTGKHKIFYLSGYVLLAIGLGLFPLTTVVWFWMALAFLQGVGSGTTNTVAAMFIVEYRPKEEWDARIGWMQTFYGVGQCLGLVLVAYLETDPKLGLLLSAGLMLPGLLLGARGLPPSMARKELEGKVVLVRRSHRPPRAVLTILHRYETGALQALAHLKKEWIGSFGIFMVGWFFIMLATWLIGVLFPLVMKDALGISYRVSSIYYAVGAAVGIFAYAPSATLGKRIGDGWVVILGAGMTLVSLGGLSLLAYLHTGWNVLLIPAVYVWIPIAWSPLIVGGTAWTAELATFEEGAALGFFNAAGAIASVVAAFAAGWIASNLGYGMVLVAGAASSLVAILCFVPLLFGKKIAD